MTDGNSQAETDLTDEVATEPTLPASTSIEIRGWHTDSEDEARAFGERLLSLTRELSRHLDLSRLVKVILAFDYHAALASVRGEGAVADVATANEFGEGAAMAVVVNEDGVLKNVVVAWTPLISSMFDEEDVTSQASLQSYVHELIHVDDHAFLDKTYPGGALATVATSDLHGALLAIVCPARAEYEATHRTAHIDRSTGFQFLDMLGAVLENLFEEVRRERRRYNVRQIPLEEFWPWLQERCRFVFQSLGYALGHADGVLTDETSSAESKAEYQRRLDDLESSEFGWLIPGTRDAVLPIYRQETWTSLDVFDPLIEVARRLLDQFGIELHEQPSDYWVDVPPSWDPEL